MWLLIQDRGKVMSRITRDVAIDIMWPLFMPADKPDREMVEQHLRQYTEDFTRDYCFEVDQRRLLVFVTR